MGLLRFPIPKVEYFIGHIKGSGIRTFDPKLPQQQFQKLAIFLTLCETLKNFQKSRFYLNECQTFFLNLGLCNTFVGPRGNHISLFVSLK